MDCAPMHGNRCFVTLALCLSAAAAFLAIALLFGNQSPRMRAARLTETAQEIRRGNYYAWVQAKHWSDKLTQKERKFLAEVCSQYFHTNQVLHAHGNSWPPKPPSTSWRWRAGMSWVRRVLGLRESSLVYEDTITCPSTAEVPANLFEGILGVTVQNGK
jgi:hypothetical protein